MATSMQLCCAQRMHIISCVKRGKSQSETFRLLQEVYGEDSLSVTTCRRCYLQAKEGDSSGKDLQRPGRKPTSRTLANVRAVDQVIQQDRRSTVRQIAAEVNISKGFVHAILKQDLSMSKKAPKFMPRMLTAEQKELRMSLCRSNLKEVQDPLFLWSVITGDESWFSVLEPEQKQQSLQWIAKGEKRPKKALRSWQARKNMMEVFFNDQGVVHLEFLPPGMTVTANVYTGILACLREAVRRKRPVLWQQNSYRLLHDNAPGHKANHTVTAMMETDKKEVPHPPYSPDLAPADFWFFPYLKSQIRGHAFQSVANLQDELVRIIQNTPTKLFSDCIHRHLPDRWRKCIAAHGEYFEGDNIIPPPDSELLDSSSSDSD